MARLGKRERFSKRSNYEAWKTYKQEVVRSNLSSPKPEAPLLSRDETSLLKGNAHTRGISIGQRKSVWQKPGTF